MTTDGYVSFAVEDLSEGSFGTGVQIITGARFEQFDFNAKAEPRMCLRLDMYSPEHNSSSSQYWGVGDPLTWSVSPDGNSLRNNKGGSLMATSGFAQFIKGLANAGFPADKLKTGKASNFAGLKLNMVEVKTGRKDSNDKEITATVPSAILAWDARAEVPSAGVQQPAAPVPPPTIAAPPPMGVPAPMTPPPMAVPQPMAPPAPPPIVASVPPPMAPPAPVAAVMAPSNNGLSTVEAAIVATIGELGMASSQIEIGTLAFKLFSANTDQAFQQSATPLLFGEGIARLAALHGFRKAAWQQYAGQGVMPTFDRIVLDIETAADWIDPPLHSRGDETRHVTALVSKAYGLKYGTQRPPPGVFEMGRIWEYAARPLVAEWARRQGGRAVFYLPPLEKDGIVGSLDSLIFWPDSISVVDMKFTFNTLKNPLERTAWMGQFMAYCHMVGSTTAYVPNLTVNVRPPGAIITIWVIHFDQIEIDRNWQALVDSR